ncbi:glycosyltransferase family 9 protein [Burkholderia gladioli]|uniref:glycosyltransferase family 9 protein n=1 Tax=Burkholderia gladioli TaxID=28095 RepID=UPI0034DB58AC
MQDPAALASAYLAYLNDPHGDAGLALARRLREAGHAAAAIEQAGRCAAAAETPFALALAGVEMNYLGRFAEAEALLTRAEAGLAGDPNLYIVRFEQTVARYGQGHYREAHRLYRELRDATHRQVIVETLYPGHRGSFEWAERKFLGHQDSVAGKRVLVMMEGGAGDLFMHSRYLACLKQEGAASIDVQVPEVARGVLRSDGLVRESGPHIGSLAEDCDCVTWLFNLFARYQATPYQPRFDQPYLEAPQAAALPEAVRAALDAPNQARIGLVWHSNSGVRHEPYRSIALDALAPLLAQPGCRFYSLQVGEPSEAERVAIARHGIVDLAPALRSFADTAAVLDRLDLLVSIDTGAAHLAGALGRPVWLLLSQAGDSRWLNHVDYTPWYPSMRLFRQPTLGEWQAPVAAAAEALGAREFVG